MKNNHIIYNSSIGESWWNDIEINLVELIGEPIDPIKYPIEINEILSCPVNNKDYKAMYEILMHDLLKAGVPSNHCGYLETLYRKAKENEK